MHADYLSWTEETPAAAGAHRHAGLASVVTPVHNEPDYLVRAVRSVAEQTVPVLEHIVIDDGSSDATRAVLDRLADEYPEIVVIHQPRSGAAVARNAGIAHARGRYIAFLDADDVWHERKVERQIGFMETHRCHFSYGDYLEVEHRTRARLTRYRLPDAVGHEQLLRGCPIGCLTVAYNQEALGKHYMPLVPSGHDWGLWLDLTRGGLKARKYPGLEASYSNGRPSLSSRKFRKVVHIYRLYRVREGLPRFRAMVRAVEHSLVALFKKARLIYS